MVKKAELTWVKNLQFVATADSGHSVILDSANGDMQNATGTSPMTLLLEALAGCTAMDVISILQKKRQKVTGLQVLVEGERAEEHPKVYTRIRIKYLIRGHDIAEKAVEDAIQLSQTKYCSASAMLGKSAELTHAMEIRQETA